MLAKCAFRSLHFHVIYPRLGSLHTRSTLKKFVDYVEDVPISLTTVEIHAPPARGSNEPASGGVPQGELNHKVNAIRLVRICSYSQV
jgi:hypothetical protein